MHPLDQTYLGWLEAVRTTYHQRALGGPLFRTAVPDLYGDFLQMLPPELRGTYTCQACAAFLRAYGGAVLIDNEGERHSPFWNPVAVPEPWALLTEGLRARVEHAGVQGVVVRSEQNWGLSSNPDRERGCTWYHLAVQPCAEHVYPDSPVKNAHQREAELVQDYNTVRTGLNRYKLETVEQARELLCTGQLTPSEECRGPATWLAELMRNVARAPTAARTEALVWRAVAGAPAGWAHTQSNSLATVLEDLQAGKPLETVQARFRVIMDPMNRLRPKAPPTAGQVNAAARTLESLRSVGSLSRRFARIDELPLLWKPEAELPRTAAEPERNRSMADNFRRTYGELKSGNPSGEARRMTWTRFQQEVLPAARSIRAWVRGHDNLASMVTAADPNSPPVVQWDSPQARNPFTWFHYHEGRPCSQWGLPRADYYPVSGVVLAPHLWSGGSYPQHAPAVFLLLEGAQDRHYRNGGGLFNSLLKSEYHPIRAALEDFFNRDRVANPELGSATGIRFSGKEGQTAVLEVTLKSGLQTKVTLESWY